MKRYGTNVFKPNFWTTHLCNNPNYPNMMMAYANLNNWLIGTELDVKMKEEL